MKTLIILFVKAYQRLISPLLPQSCKYYPSCSQYAVEAVGRYGAARGTVLAGWRLLRCNPLSDGGYDPVDNQRLFRPRPVSTEPAEGGNLRKESAGPGVDAFTNICSSDEEHRCHDKWRQGAAL